MAALIVVYTLVWSVLAGYLLRIKLADRRLNRQVVPVPRRDAARRRSGV